MKAMRKRGETKPGVKDQGGFTFVELLVIVAVLALLAGTLLPALANSQPNSRAFQCLNNQRQIMLAWRMYGEDNNDLLPPNDYDDSAFRVPTPDYWRNWVVTATSTFDRTNQSSLLTNKSSVLSAYVKTTKPYHCPADVYVDPQTRLSHARSVSMNSAVGTIWESSKTFGWFSGLPVGSPVQGEQLNGPYLIGGLSPNPWLTYGKFSSIMRPSPANLFVIMDEAAYTLDDGTIIIVAAASAGKTYLIDFPAGNHDGAGGIAFADGHAVIHKWQDARTYTSQLVVAPGQGSPGSLQSPDDPDCLYLGSITSALR